VIKSKKKNKKKKKRTVVHNSVRNDSQLGTRLIDVFDSGTKSVQMGKGKLLGLVRETAKNLDLGIGRLERESRKSHLNGSVGLDMCVNLCESRKKTDVRLQAFCATPLVLIPVNDFNNLCGEFNKVVVDYTARKREGDVTWSASQGRLRNQRVHHLERDIERFIKDRKA
jgi:hypothetical protein